MKPEEIKIKREELGMTQVQLAEKVGVSVRTIRNIESGQTEPQQKVMEIITEVLCPPDYGELITQLENDKDVPIVLQAPLKSLLIGRGEEDISVALASISGIFPLAARYDVDFGPAITAYCNALSTANALDPVPAEEEWLWSDIIRRLGHLGETAQWAETAMKKTQMQDEKDKLEAVKYVLMVVKNLYFELEHRGECLAILRDISVLLCGAKLNEKDRVVLFVLLRDFSKAFQITQRQIIEKYSGGA